MSRVSLSRPWLEFDLGAEMQVLSWSVNRPGFVHARRILWREVRNADLTPELDVAAWLGAELEARGTSDAVTMLTSRDVGSYCEARASAGASAAHAVATVGLSNAERVGHRLPRQAGDFGTINIAVAVTCGLSQTGLLEAMSIAAQARTAAVIELGHGLPTGLATGTGTDCIAVAAPEGDVAYAGLHTEVGEALGAAVYQATLAGGRDWRETTEPGLKRKCGAPEPGPTADRHQEARR